MTNDFLNDFDSIDDGSDPFDLADGDDSSGVQVDAEALAKFSELVDEKIKILMQPKRHSPQERRDAAYWLGEAGDPRAISALVQVYRRDNKNKDVQKAAAYALGQFKALDEMIVRRPDEPVNDALDRPENRLVIETLTNIAQYNEFGRRRRIPLRTLYILMGLLVLTLAGMLAAMALVEPNSNPDRRYAERFARLEGSAARVAFQQAEILTTDFKADVEQLKAQANAETLNCAIRLNQPVAFMPSAAAVEALPAFNVFATNYNAQRDRLLSVKSDFDSACREGTVLPASTRGTMSATLAEFNASMMDRALSALETQLIALEADAEAQVTATAVFAQTATAEALVTPTPTLTLTATPGVPIDEINRQIGLLARTIGDASDGLNTLDQYWTNAEETGTTQDCISVPPVIPQNYTLPEDFAVYVPELKTVSDLVNAGLELTRASYATFRQGCDAFNLTGVLMLGQETIRTARISLDTAQSELDAYTAKLRATP